VNISILIRAKKYLVHPIARNVVSLYALQWAGYVIPLLTLPYLARVLRPQGFGLLLFSQSYAIWASLLIEYGFNYSATRDVARARDNEGALTQIAASVLGAKLLLFSSIVVISVTAILCVPIFRTHPIYLLCTLPQILAGGFSPFWYFQGTELMVRVISVEFSARVLFTSLIFLAVHNSGDGWKALLLQGCAGCSSTLITTLLMYREIAFARPRWPKSREALRDGWSMFLFRGSYSIFATANAFILGLMASPVQVGLYGGGERIARAMQSQITPMTQAFYPRISHMFLKSEASAKRMARMVIGISGFAGLLLGLGLALLAHPLTRILLGPGYDGSVTVVRVFALLLPISSLNNGLIMHWMLPQRMDSKASRSIQGAIVVNVAAAVLLAPKFAHVGMAFAVLAAETFMLATIVVILVRSGTVSRAGGGNKTQNPVELA
jgi:PST family polysaccharide transporter